MGRRARGLSRECDRQDMCDLSIGTVLAHSPQGSDGQWPCETVCKLLEHYSSQDIEHRLEIAVYNRRGAYFRAPGGDQERKLAQKFRSYAEQIEARWSRAGAVLRRIQSYYEHEAEKYDRRSRDGEFE